MSKIFVWSYRRKEEFKHEDHEISRKRYHQDYITSNFLALCEITVHMLHHLVHHLSMKCRD